MASQRPRQPTAARSGGAASTVTAKPKGMYALHTPSASLRSSGAAAAKMSAAAETDTVMNPMPSTTREVISQTGPAARVPAAPPIASSDSPAMQERKGPARSAATPKRMAVKVAMALNIATTQPAATRERLNSCARPGSAGGSLPTYAAATTPVAIAAATAGQRVTAVMRRRSGRAGGRRAPTCWPLYRDHQRKER